MFWKKPKLECIITEKTSTDLRITKCITTYIFKNNDMFQIDEIGSWRSYIKNISVYKMKEIILQRLKNNKFIEYNNVAYQVEDISKISFDIENKEEITKWNEYICKRCEKNIGQYFTHICGNYFTKVYHYSKEECQNVIEEAIKKRMSEQL